MKRINTGRIVKKPRWAKIKMFKLVDKNYHKSPIAPCHRSTRSEEHGAKDCGTTLLYKRHTIVTSPNGVCKDESHRCCFGISVCGEPIFYFDKAGRTVIAVWVPRREKRVLKLWVGNELKEGEWHLSR